MSNKLIEITDLNYDVRDISLMSLCQNTVIMYNKDIMCHYVNNVHKIIKDFIYKAEPNFNTEKFKSNANELYTNDGSKLLFEYPSHHTVYDIKRYESFYCLMQYMDNCVKSFDTYTMSVPEGGSILYNNTLYMPESFKINYFEEAFAHLYNIILKCDNDYSRYVDTESSVFEDVSPFILDKETTVSICNKMDALVSDIAKLYNEKYYASLGGRDKVIYSLSLSKRMAKHITHVFSTYEPSIVLDNPDFFNFNEDDFNNYSIESSTDSEDMYCDSEQCYDEE